MSYRWKHGVERLIVNVEVNGGVVPCWYEHPMRPSRRSAAPLSRFDRLDPPPAPPGPGDVDSLWREFTVPEIARWFGIPAHILEGEALVGWDMAGRESGRPVWDAPGYRRGGAS